MHAMPAACSVLYGARHRISRRHGAEGADTHEMKPQIIAEGAIRAMTFAWDGASALSTPIWIPSEDRFAKPHRQ